MEGEAGEGWGDDAELVLDEGELERSSSLLCSANSVLKRKSAKINKVDKKNI